MQQKYASTSTIIRLEVGVFLSVIRDHLLAVVNGSRFLLKRRFHLSLQHLMAYSGHDTDVFFLLTAFSGHSQQIVPYSAVIAIELLGPKPPAPKNAYRLRLVYKQGYLDNEGQYVQFGACSTQPAEQGCPLEDVLTYLSPLFFDPRDFDTECQVEHRRGLPYPLLFSSGSVTSFPCTSHVKPRAYVVYISAAFATLAILGVVALLLVIFFRRRHRRDGYLQNELNDTSDYTCKA